MNPSSDDRRAAFEATFPDLARRLAALPPPQSRAVVRNGETVNVTIDGRPLYPEDARPWAERQVAEYAAAPDRLILGDLSHCPPPPFLAECTDDIRHFLAARPGIAGSPQPVVDAGYCFVFGVGLGHHIPLLLDRFRFRTLVLIEPAPELLIHSIDSIDWPEIAARCARDGIGIEFVLPTNPEDFVQQFYRLMERELPRWFIDGTYSFVHYAARQTLALRTLLNERIRFFRESFGFFEDDLIMVGNARANFARNRFRLLHRRATDALDIPIVAIGAGPSIDADMEHLKRLRGRALFVTCGSALGVMMRNGITPDFHVETENLELVTEVFEAWNREFDLSGVRLLGSTNLRPEALRHFGDPILFVRPNLSSTRIAAFGAEAATYGSPIVANAAVAVLAMMGFKRFYLFGMDCGTREKGRHHAADSLYFDSDMQHIPVQNDFPMEVPANFGGTAWSNPLMDASRLSFAPAVHSFGLRVFNCADGAAIDGTAPLRAADIDLPPLQADRDTVLAGRCHLLRTVDAPETAEHPTAEECAAFVEAYAVMLAGLDFATVDPWEFGAAHQRFLDTEESARPGPAVLIGPSLGVMVRIGAFYATRLLKPADRSDFLAMWATTLERAARAMAEKVVEELCG